MDISHDDLFSRDVVRSYICAPRFVRRDWLVTELQSRLDTPGTHSS